MHIPIKINGKQYFIGSDSNQYMIGPEKTAKDGTKIVDGRWFYQSLGALFTALLHKKVRASDTRSLSELRSNLSGRGGDYVGIQLQQVG